MHVLVLSSGDPVPVARIAPPIAGAIRRPLADISRALRFARGIVDLDLGQIDAEIVAGILERQGLPARPCPRSALPEAAEPRLLRDADPTEDGLHLQNLDLQQVFEVVPWSRLRFSAVGTVEFPSGPRPQPLGMTTPDDQEPSELGAAFGAALALMPLTGIHPYLGVGRTVEPKPRSRAPREGETLHVLDLVLRDPDERYRVISGRFVYDYLGERMALTSTENFRSLILDIARFAPDALLTSTTQSFLTDPRSKTHKFSSPREFENYVRWALAWTVVWA